MSENTGVKWIWFLAGLGIGVAAGMMTAPSSGATTRHLIGSKAGQAGDFLATSGKEYYERGWELYERGRHLADEAAELFEEGRRLIESADRSGISA
jgi:gas vesicle protein